MTGQRDDLTKIPATDGLVRVHCERCDHALFAVLYDPKAQGCHVECAGCGKVMFL